MHDSLAISLCNEVLCDPETSDVRVYCRTLSLLILTPSNQVCMWGGMEPQVLHNCILVIQN